ncbi:unnamed protein product [Choristocarpus tenellus]
MLKLVVTAMALLMGGRPGSYLSKASLSKLVSCSSPTFFPVRHGSTKRNGMKRPRFSRLGCNLEDATGSEDKLGTRIDPLAIDTLRWVRTTVVGLNLCPWAAGALTGGRLRVVVTPPGSDAADFVSAALGEASSLATLTGEAAGNATTLVVARPPLLEDFNAYLNAAGLLDDLIDQEGLRGIVQLATFHPLYCFEGAKKGDVENYTNRSPYPTLHLLLENQVEKAVREIEDPAVVWQKNVKTTRKLGVDAMQLKLEACTSTDLKRGE